MRDYPAAHAIHEANCPDAPKGLLILRAHVLEQAYPTGVPHSCISRETVLQNREVVAEAVDYEPHAYRPSGATQPDATRPLCRTCRGTHPDVAAPLGVLS